jgi:catechol 2,3-dioxygenase-like lactoylglutathione lyase family enzyme
MAFAPSQSRSEAEETMETRRVRPKRPCEPACGEKSDRNRPSRVECAVGARLDTSRRILLVAAATFMLQWSAGISSAPLSTPNKTGVSMGHVHYNVRDVEAHKVFWTALGAEPVKFGATDVMKFPDILIFLTRTEAKGSTDGSVVSHVAFKVPDLGPVLAALEKAGQKVPPRKGPTADLNAQIVQTPEGDAVELFNGNREIVRFIPDAGEGDPAAHRHNRPMTVPIATHHIHLYVPEGADEKARDWYVAMFGAIPGIRFRYKAADLPGMTMNFLGQPDRRAPTKGRTLDHIGFEIKGLEAFCKALEGKGVKFDVPFARGRDGLATAFLTDPWGTYIELTEGLNTL